MKELQLSKIQLDEYGRVIIMDEVTLNAISGAIQQFENNILDNVNCSGSNSGCDNTSC